MADKYHSIHTGQVIDAAITKVLNPSTTFNPEDEGKLADAKAVGELVTAEKERAEDTYAKTEALENGTIVPAKALLADNFDTKMVLNDKSAFNFRPTATTGSMELEVGSPCKVKGIVGGSIGWNQLLKQQENSTGDFNYTVTNNLVTAERMTELTSSFAIAQMTYTPNKPDLIAGHKYLAICDLKTLSLAAEASYVSVYIYGMPESATPTSYIKSLSSRITSAGFYGKIIECPASVSNRDVYIGVWGASWSIGDTVSAYSQLFDLTAKLGSTIADYIYSLEQANEGDGVAWFKRYFPKDYYPYKAIDGSLVHVRTSGKKYTKFNQFDITTKTDNSAFAWLTGLIVGEQKSIASDYIKVVCGQICYCNYRAQWCFYDANKNYIGAYDRTSVPKKLVGTEVNLCPIPQIYDIAYVRLGIRTAQNGGADMTTKTDINLNFHYDGERDGEYEAHESTYIPMDDGELIGIPYLDENGNLCFDGNVYNPDGSVDEGKGIVDMGTLEWVYSDVAKRFSATLVGIKQSSYTIPFIFTSKYKYSTDVYAHDNGAGIVDLKAICHAITSILVRDDSYTDAATLKAALSGVYLVYEKETATAGTARTPYAETQPDDNWGTEEFLPPVSDTRPVEVPVGHDTDYLPDYKAKTEVAADMPGEDGYYVLKHDESNENNVNQFVPASEITTPINERVDVTLENIGGTLRQLLAVSQNIDFLNTAYVDMGSLTWYYSSGTQMFMANIEDAKADSDCKGISSKYKYNYVAEIANKEFRFIYGGYTSGITAVAVKDASYTDATAFKAAMKGILLAYEKAST